MIGSSRSGSLPPSIASVNRSRVALGREVAGELGDEQPPVGEDQDAEMACRLDEPGRRDRLPRRGRMPEAVAAHGAWILAGERRLLVDLVLDHAGVEVVVLLVELGRVGVDHMPVAVPVAVAVLVAGPLARGDQLREHARERVDLMAAEVGARCRGRRRRGEHALEAEHEAVADAPAVRGRLAAGVHLGDRVVERGAAGGAGRERGAGSSPAWRNGSPYQA